ncbi:serine hydrolase domain-containing protein [Acidaminococcus massiliensis]|uniref:serine hydrolase domain-containing protein n=1 Tax=Acidaminococcus massiliensis TaxID=1852375 RepID=UPI00094E651B|nr:serine hydrolase [Acidaminococcus massiliensis]
MMEKQKILQSAAPEEVGISSKDLAAFYAKLDSCGIEFHHVSIARHGKLIAQGSWNPYKNEIPHMTHSLTKLLTNTAVGIVCDEGVISLDDKVASFFPDEVQGITDKRVYRMTVRDLITMRCGHAHLISGNKWRPIKTSWVAEFFKEPLAYEPGVHFQYTSATSYILSAIVQKVTGKTTFEYLYDRLLKDMQFGKMRWDKCPHGICSGGNGITMTNVDALKIGLLYLNDGIWNGKRYLSHQWIQEAMVDSCKLNPDTGYGFHLCNEDGVISSGGIFGQTVVMVPKLDMVVSINAAHPGNRPNALDKAMRDLLEKYLFSIVHEDALPENPDAYEKMKNYLGQLDLPCPESFQGQSFSDFPSGLYRAEENIDGIKNFSFAFGKENLNFTMTDARGTHSVLCGYRNWEYTESSMTGNYLHHQYQPDCTPVAAKVFRIDKNTLVMKWAWVEMTFVDTVVCNFEGDRLRFKRFVNVNTQDTERPEVIAYREQQ